LSGQALKAFFFENSNNNESMRSIQMTRRLEICALIIFAVGIAITVLGCDGGKLRGPIGGSGSQSEFEGALGGLVVADAESDELMRLLLSFEADWKSELPDLDIKAVESWQLQEPPVFDLQTSSEQLDRVLQSVDEEVIRGFLSRPPMRRAVLKSKADLSWYSDTSASGILSRMQIPIRCIVIQSINDKKPELAWQWFRMLIRANEYQRFYCGLDERAQYNVDLRRNLFVLSRCAKIDDMPADIRDFIVRTYHFMKWSAGCLEAQLSWTSLSFVILDSDSEGFHDSNISSALETAYAMNRAFELRFRTFQDGYESFFDKHSGDTFTTRHSQFADGDILEYGHVIQLLPAYDAVLQSEWDTRSYMAAVMTVIEPRANLTSRNATFAHYLQELNVPVDYAEMEELKEGGVTFFHDSQYSALSWRLMFMKER